MEHKNVTEHKNIPTPDPKFFERMELYENTVACKRTDKILAAPLISQLPIRLYNETTVQDSMMNYANCESSYIRYHQEFQPDLCYGPQSMFPTGPLDVLDCQYIRYPGKHLSDPNASFQVVDKENGYMSADEYLEYAEDPTGFFLRKILPRHHAFETISKAGEIMHGIAQAGGKILGTLAGFKSLRRSNHRMWRDSSSLCGRPMGQ